MGNEMYFTTSIAIVAGVCLGVAAIYLFVGVRRAPDRSRNLLFGFFSIAYAGAILGARAYYLAATPEQTAGADRVSGVFAVAGFCLLAWYVASYTGVRPRRFLWLVTAMYAAVGFAYFFLPSLVEYSVAPTLQTLPWNETILVPQADSAQLFPLLFIAQVATIVYVIVADVAQFRRGQRPESLALAIGIGWFALTLVEENLVILGVIDFVILSDFGFLGFVLAMALQEAKRSVDTENALRASQETLEGMVAVRTSELEAAQGQLVAQAETRAAADERSRLAHELHDAVTQLLFSINLIAGSLPTLMRKDPAMAERTAEELQRLARGALAEMRTLLRELRPHTIAVTDLATLVGQLTDGLAARHDIPTEVRLDLEDELPADVHLAVYRIAQEALNNVAKHANASRLVVDLTGDDGHIHLSVADDGYGFDTTEVSAHHMGLEIMQERASGIGAELAVQSKPNRGTTVEVDWSGDPHD